MAQLAACSVSMGAWRKTSSKSHYHKPLLLDFPARTCSSTEATHAACVVRSGSVAASRRQRGEMVVDREKPLPVALKSQFQQQRWGAE
ncbi:MAG: hypothetical protein H6668_24390 [Ardenticatenaceae bacterium]|nr:hypothetical protein [Ardenticatenaceae bacterium]